MGERAHLSIGEVLSLVQADFPDVTISKIRFLESQGLLDPERTPSGYRKFYDRDIERLSWILAQQRDNFLPLKVIRERLDEWDATGLAPTADHQTPSSDDLPGAADPTSSRTHDDVTAEGADPAADARRAAADFAASSAVEVLTHGSDAGTTAKPTSDAAEGFDDAGAGEPTPPTPPTPPAPAGEVAMEAAPRLSPVEQPPADVHGDTWRVGPSSTSLTADELAARAGIPVAAVRELEGFSMIESRRIGAESYFEADAVAVAEACRRFLEEGVEVRHLRMYKIAAEREAGVFEQLVMPLLKQRNPEARARAVEMVAALGEAGETLHAALLRSALSDTLP